MVIVVVGVCGMLARSQPPTDGSTVASGTQANVQPIDFSQGSLPADSLVASN
jgi:hypothetical protein